MKFPSCLRFIGAAALFAGAAELVSCTQVGSAWMVGSPAAAAHDQLMWVRQDPPTFGFQRLATQSEAYPDLAYFVSSHGLPNFMAETGNRDRRYFILYYLGDREAFACRTLARDRNAVEFAGPYPITDREFRLLDGYRKDRATVPAGG